MFDSQVIGAQPDIWDGPRTECWVGQQEGIALEFRGVPRKSPILAYSNHFLVPQFVNLALHRLDIT